MQELGSGNILGLDFLSNSTCNYQLLSHFLLFELPFDYISET